MGMFKNLLYPPELPLLALVLLEALGAFIGFASLEIEFQIVTVIKRVLHICSVDSDQPRVLKIIPKE